MEMHSKRRALDKIYRRRDRYDIPEWQRDEVWPEDRKQALIDSILRGWKLPKFYLSRVSDSPEEFEVVDGQQRLATIFEFFAGNLALNTKSAKEFGGASYGDLPDEVVDAFDDYEIEYDEITDATEEELKEFFRRLQGGLTLTGSEKLNAVHSNLTNFARSLAKRKFFENRVAIRDTRKAHFDIISKVAAIEVDGIDTGLRYDDLQATFTSNAKFSADSNTGKRLRSTFDFLERAFPSQSSALRNRSTVQSIATLAALFGEKCEGDCAARFRAFVEHFDKELSKQVELGQLATDTDYLEYQRTLSANVKAGAKTRHQILLRKLLLFDASFAEVIGSQAVVASGLTEDIQRLGKAIRGLVEATNEQYSAREGEDLFKATNKTMAALGRLGNPITDFASYKSLVDDLYFVFRESAGQRLAGKEPESFKDVNDLRTALRHDIDHGKPSEIAKKKKKLGQAFAKYGGHGAPGGLAPERFPVIQSAILGKIEADLRELASPPANAAK